MSERFSKVIGEHCPEFDIGASDPNHIEIFDKMSGHSVLVPNKYLVCFSEALADADKYVNSSLVSPEGKNDV